MAPNTKKWQAVLALGVTLCAGSWAFAVSGRGLAISRAFSYAYNNPQPDMGYGPLGSSVYTSGGDFNIPHSGVAPVPTGVQVNGPLTYSPPSRAYAPLTAMTVGAGGYSYVVPSGAGSGGANPISQMVLAEASTQPAYERPWLTSLAPAGPGSVRFPMVQGESQLRDGDYQQALVSFDAARKASGDSAESYLSLAHVYFAMGDKTYDQAADSLAKAIQCQPDLPLIRVRPKDFFADPDAYAKAFAALESYVKDNPQSAGPLFLLGYLQWREGVVDKALHSLDAAAAASPRKDMAQAVADMIDGIARSGKIVLSEAPTLEEARDYAWAGVRLAVPAGFKGNPLTSLNQVLSGIVVGKDPAALQIVTFNAYPVNETVSLKAFMDSVMDSMRQSPSIRDMATDAELEVPFKTGKALVRSFTYSTTGGAKIATAWVAFIHEPKDKNGHAVAYILGVASGDSQADRLLPTLAAMAKTVVLSDPMEPSLASLDTQGSVVEDRAFMFSIVQPQGWVGRQTDRGYEMAQMDFARGNVITPKVEVIVKTVAATYTAESFGEEAVKRPPPKGMVRTGLSKGPSSLGGQGGYQFVASQKPEDNAEGASSILVGRLICVRRDGGEKTMYAVVVECRGVEAKEAEAVAVAEKVAAGFKILEPAKAAPAPGK